MKLVSRYNKVNILTTIFILLLSSLTYYYILRKTLIHQLDKELRIEEKEVRNFVKEYQKMPEPTNLKDEKQEFLPVADSISTKFHSFETYDKVENESVSERQIEFGLSAQGRWFKAVISKSQVETEDLIKLILKFTLGLILLLLTTLFFINRFFFRSLWSSFRHTLDQLRDFNISENKPIALKYSGIEEFQELNEVVTLMTRKAMKDYSEIKDFTENASHEIQTPLAIIKAKLELLSQGESIKEDQMNNIQAIFDATNRLSRLNQSLLLLTKIDNNQFHLTSGVQLSTICEQLVKNYEEIILGKHILLEQNISGGIEVNMNESLAEILVSNLLTNAIKHNYDGGFIKIELSTQQLIVTNSGMPLAIPVQVLFERFRKEKADSESLGLGLAIVKKISDLYNLSINYTCYDSIHKVTLHLHPSSTVN
ncbi:MAG: hypothetical protein NVSMB45_18000 [Ginsengibacter sp.]